jgi:uncharacterized membrane protein YfcA
VAVLVVVFLIVLLASFTQAITGFGFALVAVPLLALATDPRGAVVVEGLVSVGATLLAAVRERDHVRWRTAGRLLACAVAGLPLGLLVLRVTPARVLTALIALCVLACTLLVWRRIRLRHHGPVTVAAVGVLVGTLSTSTGTTGPPLVAAFQAMGYDRHTFRATLAAVFAGTGVLSIAGFVAVGLVDAKVTRLALVGLPAVVIGWLVGDRVFTRIDATAFRRIVLVALVATAAVTLTRAVAP